MSLGINFMGNYCSHSTFPVTFGNTIRPQFLKTNATRLDNYGNHTLIT